MNGNAYGYWQPHVQVQHYNQDWQNDRVHGTGLMSFDYGTTTQQQQYTSWDFVPFPQQQQQQAPAQQQIVWQPQQVLQPD
ncbi:MAG: hypothetical protein R2857_15945 [Vampirovibrionales bacterium]